jgi:hypothetical protein
MRGYQGSFAGHISVPMYSGKGSMVLSNESNLVILFVGLVAGRLAV